MPLTEVARSPLLATMLQWWQARCRDKGCLIGRKAIDPLDLPRQAFSHLSLLEFVNAPSFRMRVVLAGEGVCALFGRNLKGAIVDELYRAEDYEVALADIGGMVATREPVAVYREVVSPDDRLITYFLLMLPLASDGTTVDGIVSTLDWKITPRI
ncbi:MAG: PAS domain-containing protein [Rhodospirillaceae bacterium]|nr:PAS domain-containing protein [Rhodospirillaceae bacterium]